MKTREQYIIDFLEIVIEDLKISTLLYENKKYTHSIYFLQQSVEKTAKARALDFYKIEPQKLAKIISHEIPIVIYIEIGKLYKRIIRFGRIFNEIVGKKEEFIKIVEEYEKKEPLLKALKKQDYRKLGREFKKISRDFI